MKKTYKINGMHCNSCENLIENELKEKQGINSISASFEKEQAEIDFDENKISEKEIKDKIKEFFKKLSRNQAASASSTKEPLKAATASKNPSKTSRISPSFNLPAFSNLSKSSNFLSEL